MKDDHVRNRRDRAPLFRAWTAAICGLSPILLPGFLMHVSAQSPSPLHVEPLELELGTLSQHEIVRHQLVLFNDGPGTITIKQVGKTCPACLTFAPEDQVLDPGATAILDVLYDPAGYEGEVEEYIVLETDHPRVRNLAIPVRAYVERPYTVEGAPFILEVLEADRPAVQWVKITPNFGMKGQLTGLATPDAVFDVTMEHDPTEGPWSWAKITTKAGLAAGMTQAVLEIVSSDPTDPICFIKAGTFLPPPFHFYPSALKIGPVNREQMRIVFTRQSLAPPARIIEIDLPDENAWYEFLPDGVAESRLNLYFHGMRGRDGHIGDVVLKTDHPQVGDIRIPVWVDKDYKQTLRATKLLSGVKKKGCCGGR